MKGRAGIIAAGASVFILGTVLCFFRACRTAPVSIGRAGSARVQTDIKARMSDDASRRTDEMQEQKRPYAAVTAEREAEAQAEVDAGEFDSYMPESRKTAAMIRLSLDEGDLRGVREASRVAASGKDPKLKKSAVAALGWFGGSAVPDLMKFLSDADKDVGAVAAENLERAIDELDDPDARFRAAFDAIRKSSNEDFTAIMEMTAQVSMTEKLESADESAKAFMRRDFVSRISELMSAGKTDVAAEMFRDVAGTAWRGEDDAVKWADDPNSYEEPES